MSDGLKLILLKIGFVVVVIAIIAANLLRNLKYGKHNKGRREKFLEIAKLLGGLFKDELSNSFIESLSPSFEQFKWHMARADRYGYNVIEVIRNDINWIIFDYSSKHVVPYAWGASQTFFQTCFFADIQNLYFPYFRIESKVKNSVKFPKILDTPLSSDFINFDNYSVFSKMFNVFGENKNAVKKLFSLRFIGFLEKLDKDIYMEAVGSRIVLTVKAVADANDLPGILEKAEQIIKLLKETLPSIKNEIDIHRLAPKYCPNCRKEYDGSWKVCLYCRTPLSENKIQ